MKFDLHIIGLIVGILFTAIGGLTVFSRRFFASISRTLWKPSESDRRSMSLEATNSFNKYGRGLGLFVGGIIILVMMLQFYLSPEPPFDLAGGCAETSSTETLAPAKAAIAKEAVVNCGATSDYATQVTIKDPKTGASGLVLSMKGDQMNNCATEWLDESTLKIQCDAVVDFVYESKNQFEQTKVIFDPPLLGLPTR